MTSQQEMQTAMVNRSIRTIKAELEYLCDANVISPQTLSELLSAIPEQTALRAPISVGAMPSALPIVNPTPPTNGISNQSNTNGTKQNEHYNEKSSTPQQQPPPAYNQNPPPPTANWPPLCEATALYAYTSTDAGDLELQPNDHVTVTEYMNAEWWKGKSTRTGQEGIFPRSYVKVVEKSLPANGQPTNYGNMPVQVAEGNGEGSNQPGKAEQQGKKFGKKLGNAAIFGAGATIGSNIVNSIF